MKRILSFMLCILMLTSILTFTAGASESSAVTKVVSQETEYLDNGFYIVTTVTETYDVASARATMQSKTGSKTANLYNSSNTILYSLTVYGTFQYNGVYSKATASSYSYTVDPTYWTFSSGSSSYSDNYATATATFKPVLLGSSRTQSVTVSCSEDGTIY